MSWLSRRSSSVWMTSPYCTTQVCTAGQGPRGEEFGRAAQGHPYRLDGSPWKKWKNPLIPPSLWAGGDAQGRGHLSQQGGERCGSNGSW